MLQKAEEMQSKHCEVEEKMNEKLEGCFTWTTVK